MLPSDVFFQGKNAYAPKADPAGSLRRSPDHLVGWGGGHPSPFPSLSTPSRLHVGASLLGSLQYKFVAMRLGTQHAQCRGS